jgi:hypothetical protein
VLSRTTAPTRPSTSTSVPSASGTTGLPAFSGTRRPIDAALAQRMRSTWRPGCPVPLSELSDLTLSYVGFDGRSHTGEMVVASAVADDVITVFRALYRSRFPIRRMQLVDDFGGNDDASMAADNTSGFNCRPTTSGASWSQHSYGRAVDVDPVENPYVDGDTVLPTARFADRPDAPGVIHDGDAAVRAFAAVGWSWGGDWSSPTDYQHFSQNGR